MTSLLRHGLFPLTLAATIAATGLGAADIEAQSLQAETRGFGSVAVDLRAIGDGTVTTFTAEDAAHAVVCASKRLNDLTDFGDLAVVAKAGISGTVVTRDGVGAWLLGIRGNQFIECYAPSMPALTTHAAALGDLDPVPDKAYPRWLDCFDTAGLGVWVGGGGDQYDLPNDFEWLRERKLTMCTLSPNESRLIAPGLHDTTIYDWHRSVAEEYNLPYRVLQFPKNPAWAWNRTPLPYVRPAPGFLPFPFVEWAGRAMYSTSEPNRANDPFVHDGRRRLAEYLEDDPNLIGWHGSTEIPNAGIMELAIIAQTDGIKELWHRYLSDELGFDLADISRLHRGNGQAYRSWDQVEVPLPQDFIGIDRPGTIDLSGTWHARPDPEGVGREAGWFDPKNADQGAWTPTDHNDPMILMYGRMHNQDKETPPFWMRRSFALDATAANRARFLHIARSRYHGNFQPSFDAWVNGTKVPLVTNDVRGDWSQCFDLEGTLQPGDNTIVLDTHGSPIPGYILINDQGFSTYPAMDNTHNRLWYDGTNFSAWLRIRHIEGNLKAVRSVDPVRPLKMMALINLLDMSGELCERYGAYQHDTGGGAAYWCPMTGARLARTYGLPWSCEQGSPPKSVEELQKSTTLYLMYGNDATDMVFGVGHYSNRPEIGAWFDQNLELLRCTGRMALPPQRIGILRSTRNTRLGFSEPWNWDIGRGTLQAVGRTFSYAETPDLANGRASQFDVLFDCGTLLMTEADIDGIERFVRDGGVFIAQHHTGRHSPDQANSYPIGRVNGLTLHAQGESVDQAELLFTDEQNLWPTLRGRRFKGKGLVLDYRNRDVTGRSIGLQADSDGVEIIAQWAGRSPEDGSIAIASRRLGKGRIITLGSTFWRDSMDAGGAYRESAEAQNIIDELLTSLGIERESWSGNDRVWAERWRSKNGVFDLYPVAHMNESMQHLPDTADVSPQIRRGSPPAEVIEISAIGHPKVDVTWADGRLTLPAETYDRMKSRVYLAPRDDRGRAAFDWFATQAKIWRALPPIAPAERPAVIEVPQDIVPLATGWRLGPVTNRPADPAATPEWVTGETASWREVRLGAFSTLGLDERAIARFATEVTIPKSWAGRRVRLVFDAEHWFFGLIPQGRLWIDGHPAAMDNPLKPKPNPGFALDVTDQAGDGIIRLALEIDGTARDWNKGQGRPNGVTGTFYLQSETIPTTVQTLDNWQAATDFNQLVPVTDDQSAHFVYQQTTFTLPTDRPEGRLFLEREGPIGSVVLNGKMLETPMWMTRLDISGLINDSGPNVLRWAPQRFDHRKVHQGGEPGFRLAWCP